MHSYIKSKALLRVKLRRTLLRSGKKTTALSTYGARTRLHCVALAKQWWRWRELNPRPVRIHLPIVHKIS